MVGCNASARPDAAPAACPVVVAAGNFIPTNVIFNFLMSQILYVQARLI